MTNSVVVVGGGPAGMMLGLLLARAAVPVTVLEKHADFLRDFRGDTVHASTLTLLDELGLGERFAALPQRRLVRAQVQLDGGVAQVGDLSRLPGAHRHIALVPQWDFLDLLAEAAEQEPTFTLRRNAEVVGLLRDERRTGGTGTSHERHSRSFGWREGAVRATAGGRVAGVRYRDRVSGEDHDLRADLVVACDGRGSAVRAAAGLAPRSFGVPMDVWWFRLPRRSGDPTGAVFRVSTGRLAVLIDRGDYWQCGYLICKGSDAAFRAAGVQAFRDRFAALLPWLGDRVDTVESLAQVRLLEVRLERLRRWYADGLLLIGDAAHAMSPVGGVGINLAVADAVAAARLLAPALRAVAPVPIAALRRVQLRRWWPTALVQTGQRLAHRAVLGRALRGPALAPVGTGGSTALRQDPAGHGRDEHSGDPSRRRSPPRSSRPRNDCVRSSEAPLLPAPLRLLRRFPALQAIPARLIAIGPLPEHAPGWARRSSRATRRPQPLGRTEVPATPHDPDLPP